MYSKLAMNLYEELLEKVTPKMSFTPLKEVTNNVKLAFKSKEFLEKAYTTFKDLIKSDIPKKYPEAFKKFIKDLEIKGDVSKLEEAIPTYFKPSLTEGKVPTKLLWGIPATAAGTYYLTNRYRKGLEKSKKLKEDLKALNLGLLAPILYSSTKSVGGYKNLQNLLSEGKLPSYADFTSI